MDKKETVQTGEESYTTPDFEVVEIQFEQRILAGGSDFDFGDGGDL